MVVFSLSLALLCLGQQCQLISTASQGAAWGPGACWRTEMARLRCPSTSPFPRYSHSVDVLLINMYHYLKGRIIWVLFSFHFYSFSVPVKECLL